MATSPGSPQRAYRAACPNCGAPVEFASAASASAVCGFCRSTLVRDGQALLRIGTSAELFDDHSPLQLGAGGTHQGVAFTLVGRLQYGYEGGTWNEWHALFDNGPDGKRSGWLSEDNGAYVMAFEAPTPADAPALDTLTAGQRVLADRRPWDVASVVRAHLVAAQGELPRPPQLHGDFLVADLRSGGDEVATLDGSDPGQVGWSIGRPVLLAALAMSGLAAGAGEKTLGARGVACPSCGNPLEIKLASTKSISCGQCNAVVDVSAGVGGELQHYTQSNTSEGGLGPQIPLGNTGNLALGTSEAQPWQVVGYQERCDIPEAGSDDEQTFWREYLLYNRSLGFAFLVDAEDGWSWVRPITGAPQVKGDRAQYKGAGYQKKYSYDAKVTWVQGEFYWKVTRGERAHVTDYVGVGGDSRKRLSREQTRSTASEKAGDKAGTEVVWSAGAVLEANVVADAFGIPAGDRAAMQRDVAPVSGSAKGMSIGNIIVVIVVLLILLSMLSECDGSDRCDELRQAFGPNSNEYKQCVAQRGSGSSSGRTSGGSWGGGGHK